MLLLGFFTLGISLSYIPKIKVNKPYASVYCIVVDMPDKKANYVKTKCTVLKSDIKGLKGEKITFFLREVREDIFLFSKIGFIGKIKQKGKNIYAYPVKNFVQIEKSPIGFILDFKNFLIRNYEKNSLNRDTFGIGKALIFGERNNIPLRIKENFIETGLVHLLAISGLHIGILVAVLMFFIRNEHLRDRLILLILPLYALFTGLHIPVVRASIMGFLYFFGKIKELRINPLNILFFVGFIVVLVSPETLFSIGFQLSFIATLGIVLALDFISVKLFKKDVFNIPVQLFILSFVATIFTLPVVLYHFNGFSPITILATPVAIIPLYIFIALSVPNLITCFSIEPFVKLMDYVGLIFIKTVSFFNFSGSYIKGFSPNIPEVLIFLLILILIFKVRLNFFYKLTFSLVAVLVFLILTKEYFSGYRLYVFKGQHRPYFVVSKTGDFSVIVSNRINMNIRKTLNRENPKVIYMLTKDKYQLFDTSYQPIPEGTCIEDLCVYFDRVFIDSREIKLKNDTYVQEFEKK